MLKYIIGTLTSFAGKTTEVVVFTLGNTHLGIVDIVDELNLTKKENGFCQITDNGFFYFYGGNTTSHTNVIMNDLLRKCKVRHFIYKGKSSNHYDGYLWVFIKEDEIKDVSFNKGEEVLSFDESVISINQNFKNYFNV